MAGLPYIPKNPLSSSSTNGSASSCQKINGIQYEIYLSCRIVLINTHLAPNTLHQTWGHKSLSLQKQPLDRKILLRVISIIEV